MFFIERERKERMVYVIQVFGGHEKRLWKLCNSMVPHHLFKECFYLKYERVWKEKGRREIITLPMFPGYLFIDTEEIEEIQKNLRKIPELTKLLKVGAEVVEVSKNDIEFLSRADENHVFKMSRGRIIDGYVQIEEGAFEGFYGKLERINRHNCYGIMKINIFGKEREVEIGLMIEKGK